MNSIQQLRGDKLPGLGIIDIWCLLLLAFLILARSQSLAGPLERRLYVADKSGLSVYDIDQGHKLIRKIELPDSGDYKGICASPALGKLYLTSNTRDELICLDLITETIAWRKPYGKYADSMAITPDGKTIYLPCRHDGSWWVINAAGGEVLTKIETGRGKQYGENPIGDFGPHNTWCNPSGTRMYMEVLTVPDVFIADTATHKIIGKVGPFSRGVRPFTVSDDEKYLFANVDGLLGFEVGEVKSRKVIHRVEARTPPHRISQIKNPTARKPHSTPSHGINLRPDQKEAWVVDGVHGYVFVYDVTVMPPKHNADIAIFANPEEQPKPGWISFSLDGSYAYPDGGAVIDTQSKMVVARIPTSEKLIEIDFLNRKPVKAGHR